MKERFRSNIKDLHLDPELVTNIVKNMEYDDLVEKHYTTDTSVAETTKQPRKHKTNIDKVGAYIAGKPVTK